MFTNNEKMIFGDPKINPDINIPTMLMRTTIVPPRHMLRGSSAGGPYGPKENVLQLTPFKKI